MYIFLGYFQSHKHAYWNPAVSVAWCVALQFGSRLLRWEAGNDYPELVEHVNKVDFRLVFARSFTLFVTLNDLLMEVSSENSSASEEKEKVENTALHERDSNADQTTSAVGAKESHSVSVPVRKTTFVSTLVPHFTGFKHNSFTTWAFYKVANSIFATISTESHAWLPIYLILSNACVMHVPVQKFYPFHCKTFIDTGAAQFALIVSHWFALVRELLASSFTPYACKTHGNYSTLCILFLNNANL